MERVPFGGAAPQELPGDWAWQGSTATSGTKTVISVSDLRMRYGAFEAVRGLDLRVRRGEAFAFLGP